MLIMPLILSWAMAFGARGRPAIPESLSLAALALVSGFVFEITRKIKAPEAERDTVDSYSKVFGTRQAPWVVVGLLVLGAALLVLIVRQIVGSEIGVVWWLVPVLLTGAGSLPFIQFSIRPTSSATKWMEGAAGGVALLSYAFLIAALLVQRGARWS